MQWPDMMPAAMVELNSPAQVAPSASLPEVNFKSHDAPGSCGSCSSRPLRLRENEVAAQMRMSPGSRLRVPTWGGGNCGSQNNVLVSIAPPVSNMRTTEVRISSQEGCLINASLRLLGCIGLSEVQGPRLEAVLKQYSLGICLARRYLDVANLARQ